MTKETESKKVFVSHAVVDKNISDGVIDLLQTGMGLKVPDDVFCCSLQGMKIPPSENFIDYVKRMIQNPKLVILLISQNYYASQFCLAELGAIHRKSRAIDSRVP